MDGRIGFKQSYVNSGECWTCICVAVGSGLGSGFGGVGGVMSV